MPSAATTCAVRGIVYRKTAVGREEATITRRRCWSATARTRKPDMADFWEWLAEVLRHGNGLCGNRSRRCGRRTALIPIQWDHVGPKVLENGRLVYDYTDPITLNAGSPARHRCSAPPRPERITG